MNKKILALLFTACFGVQISIAQDFIQKKTIVTNLNPALGGISEKGLLYTSYQRNKLNIDNESIDVNYKVGLNLPVKIINSSFGISYGNDEEYSLFYDDSKSIEINYALCLKSENLSYLLGTAYSYNTAVSEDLFAADVPIEYKLKTNYIRVGGIITDNKFWVGTSYNLELKQTLTMHQHVNTKELSTSKFDNKVLKIHGGYNWIFDKNIFEAGLFFSRQNFHKDVYSSISPGLSFNRGDISIGAALVNYKVFCDIDTENSYCFMAAYKLNDLLLSFNYTTATIFNTFYLRLLYDFEL